MPCSSCPVTVCRASAGSTGRTVRANSVLSVLAGGRARCASCAASTSPVVASPTTHDSADTSGSAGAPERGCTCVPDVYRSEAAGRGAPGPLPVAAAAGCTGRASAQIALRAHQEEAARNENRMVITHTVGTVRVRMPRGDGPSGGRCTRMSHIRGDRSRRLSRRAAWAGRAAGRPRCRGWPASAPAGSPGSPVPHGTAERGAGLVRPSTHVPEGGALRGGCPRR